MLGGKMNLVTGAAGHLGNVLVRELLARGDAVRALILPGEDCAGLEGLPVERVEGNILDRAALQRACQGVDTLYHMAALVSLLEKDAPILHKVNVEGTRNVLEAARLCGVRRLVYTSSIHALARPPLGVAINETLPFDVHNPAGPYDRTKAEASLEVLKAAKAGLDVVIVCPTGVVGPYDFRRSEMGEMILSWMRARVSFVVPGRFDFVDVRDVARGHILAAQHGQPGETYILGGEGIDVGHLCALVKASAGQRATHAPILSVPTRLALFAAYFAQIYYTWTHTRPCFTRYSLETLQSNSLISSEKARRQVGYAPRSLVESIRDTVGWWVVNQGRIRPSVRI
jgi:dihydroflavonol-4-reductase